MLNPNSYKCHCSGINDIIAKAVKGRTISVGAATAVETWLKEQMYQRRKLAVASKYTDKGNAKEADAIRFLNSCHSEFYTKNKQLFSNDYLVGTPDIITSDTIIDIKCSWDCFTFPYFDDELDKNYYCQMQGYMALTGKEKAIVAYCLMNATDEQIEQACYAYCRAHNCEYTEEIEQMISEQMRYEHLPANLRLKEFTVLRDEDFITNLYQRIEDMRAYANERLKLC